MAYRSYLKYYTAGNQAKVMADLSTYMQAQGWTLEEAVSATRHFLSTNGEDGTHTKLWIDLQVSGSYIYFIPYSWIDTASNTGYGGAYPAASVNYYRVNCSAAGYLKMFGSKDISYWEYGSSVTPTGLAAYCRFYGVIPYDKIIPKPYATTANAEAAGAGVTIEVDDTDGFQRNDYYQIFDPNSGMREKIQVTAISAGVSVTATLANAYGAGSIIAYLPCSGFCTESDTFYDRLYPVAPIGVSGSGTASAANGYWQVAALLGFGVYVGGTAAIPRNNLYQLVSMVFLGNYGSEYPVSYSYPPMGYNKTDFLLHSGLATADMIGTVDAGNVFFNGTATAGAATSMTDGGGTFADDALIGKILVITGGTGAGQSRWITDNTATVITVGQAWVTNPTSGSTYMIVDDVYRCLYNNSNLWARETIGEP